MKLKSNYRYQSVMCARLTYKVGVAVGVRNYLLG